MRIKSVLAASLFSVSTLCSIAVQADSATNFLVGLEGGYARQKENFITGFYDPTLTPVALTTIDWQTYMVSDELLFIGGLLGWQWRCDRLMLGLEGSIDAHSLTEPKAFLYSVNSSIFEGTVLYDRGPIYNMTTRAGYFVTPGFMPYLRVGAQYSHDEGTYQVFANPSGTPAATGLQSDFISSGKEWIWGFVLGIGVEFPAFIGPSTFRVEYNYTRTESIVIEDSVPPIFGTDKFRYPQTNLIKFAWVWNFVS